MKLMDVGFETDTITKQKVDWLKHRIQPFFMLKMPDKFEDMTVVTEPKLADYLTKSLGEL